MTKKEALEKAVELKLLVDKLDGVTSDAENWKKIFDAYPLKSTVSDYGLLNLIEKFEARIRYLKETLETVDSIPPKDIGVYFFDYVESMAAVYNRKFITIDVVVELAKNYPDYDYKRGVIFITQSNYELIFD